MLSQADISLPFGQWLRAVSACLTIFVLSVPVHAQSAIAAGVYGGDTTTLPDEPQPNTDKDAVTLRNTPIHILKDQ